MPNIFDYACLKIGGTDTYIRENASMAHGLISFHSPAVILTANTMSDYTDRLKEASQKYDQLDHLFIFWMHFEINNGIIEVHYKTRTNISEADAQALMDNQYATQMNEYWSIGEEIDPNPALNWRV